MERELGGRTEGHELAHIRVVASQQGNLIPVAFRLGLRAISRSVRAYLVEVCQQARTDSRYSI